MNHEKKPTIGSLFAGIGGFDLGFERAGWQTAWQVEINPINRAVLGDRFPGARQFEDVRQVGAHCLSPVDCIAGGFPCQDISLSGSRRGQKKAGLGGERSGLFFEAIRILRELQPPWVVLENVPALLHCNDSEDFQTVIKELAQCGYVGLFRVLNANHFGSPARRRRVFLVAGLGRFPPLELLADASPVESIPGTFTSVPELFRPADGWPGYTLQARDTTTQISMGSEPLVAHEKRWGSMVERGRTSQDTGVPLGLAQADIAEAFGAGNAVCVHVAEWIGRKIHPANLSGRVTDNVVTFPASAEVIPFAAPATKKAAS